MEWGFSPLLPNLFTKGRKMNADITTVKDCTTIEEALTKADLNFIAEKQELFTGAGVSADEHCAVVRTDKRKVLGIHKKDYSVLNPLEKYAVCNTLMEKYDLTFKKVVSINGGARIEIVMTGPPFTVADDNMDRQLHIRESYDGGWKFSLMFGAFRLVCSNGMIIGNKDAHIQVRHTKNAQEHIHAAMRAWERSENAFVKMEAQMNELTTKRLADYQIENMLDEIVGKVFDTNGKKSSRKENQREAIKSLYDHGKGNHGETAWDFYNGVTEYYQQHTNPGNPKARAASAIAGSGYDKAAKTWNLVTAL